MEMRNDEGCFVWSRKTYVILEDSARIG